MTKAPVVRRLDNGIHWINLYPVDNAKRFAITYPLDSDNPLDIVIRPSYNWAQKDKILCFIYRAWEIISGKNNHKRRNMIDSKSL